MLHQWQSGRSPQGGDHIMSSQEPLPIGNSYQDKTEPAGRPSAGAYHNRQDRRLHRDPLRWLPLPRRNKPAEWKRAYGHETERNETLFFYGCEFDSVMDRPHLSRFDVLHLSHEKLAELSRILAHFIGTVYERQARQVQGYIYDARQAKSNPLF
jgi:hypothetical protein